MYEFAVTPASTHLRRPGVLITEVEGRAVELELEPNDRIVRVNGRVVRDYLDFRFQTGGETELTFQVKKPDVQTNEIEFDSDETYGPGLMFEDPVSLACATDCIVCIRKCTPEAARPSLMGRVAAVPPPLLY